MKTALLTGFGQFGHYRENPTEKLMGELHQTECGAWSLTTLTLPPLVEGCFGHDIVDGALRKNCSAIVSFGMKSSARGISFESSARNLIHDARYCRHRTGGVVEVSEPKGKVRHINMEKWNMSHVLSSLRNVGIPVESSLSTDAGGFYCNYLIYQVLSAMERSKVTIPFLFVHVPCTPSAVQGISNFDPEKVLIRYDDIRRSVPIILGGCR